jgi:hypothetical protein
MRMAETLALSICELPQSCLDRTAHFTLHQRKFPLAPFSNSTVYRLYSSLPSSCDLVSFSLDKWLDRAETCLLRLGDLAHCLVEVVLVDRISVVLDSKKAAVSY